MVYEVYSRPLDGDSEIWNIFYDECKEDGYWHCFIFVPKSKTRLLFDYLQKARSCLDYWGIIRFGDIGRRAKANHTRVRLVRSWISILIYSIQQQKIEADLYLGHDSKRPVFTKIRGPENKIGAKLVVFREKEKHKDMYSSMSEAQKIETTFRMGLKGGTHLLFLNEQIIVNKIYFDAPENSFKENFDSENMLGKFKREARDYVKFTKDSEIIPICKDEYNCDDPVSNFMQLADIAVSGTRCQVCDLTDFKVRYDITRPLRDELLFKNVDNYARMKESRYFNGFRLSEAWVEGGKWDYKVIEVERERQIQISLINS